MNSTNASLRDYFAGLALVEFIRGHRHDENDRGPITRAAYGWADAMIHARSPSNRKARKVSR